MIPYPDPNLVGKSRRWISLFSEIHYLILVADVTFPSNVLF